MTEPADGRPVVTADDAARYIGKHLLVGMTYIDHAGEIVERKQWHGTIVRVNNHEGIVVLDSMRQEMKIPPAIGSIQAAAKGEYRLHSTGEVVIDPDFISTWTVELPPAERKDTQDLPTTWQPLDLYQAGAMRRGGE